MKHSQQKPTPQGEMVMQVIPMPRDTNAAGDVYAGWLVHQMDVAAATTAGRVSQGRVATVAIDRMEFLCPIRLGAQVRLHTRLTEIGRSSMKIQVEVWMLAQLDTEPRKVTEAQFIFVAIDDAGRIREVPEQAPRH